MRFFNNLKISVKLMLSIIGISVITLIAGETVQFLEARALLVEEGQRRLSAMAEARKAEIEAWLEGIEADLELEADNPATRQAVFEFTTAWQAINANPGTYLQEQYIAKNPNPTGQKHLLDYAADQSRYSFAHRSYHPHFRNLLEQKGYYDIFLFDTEGNLIYSVFKETDFATNFLTGQWRDSSLGKAYRAALQASSAEEMAFTDFAPYGPSNYAPASFLAAPVIDQAGQTLGVIAFQMPISRLDAVMQRSEGLGETGETYLAGEDRLMRNDSRFSDEPTILEGIVDNDAVTAALNGETGQITHAIEDGTVMVSSFAPVDFRGVQWALVGTQSEAELHAPANGLRNDIIIKSAISAVVIALIGYFIARSISRPLLAVQSAMTRVEEKDYESEIPAKDRKDEIGAIAATLDHFRGSLMDAEEEAKASYFRSAAFEASSACLMMVDGEFNITYANASLKDMLREHLEFLRGVRADFDPDNIVGKNMDIFHAVPSHARRILSDPANLPYRADLKIGEARLLLDIAAVCQPDGTPLGFVVEWSDVTKRVLVNAMLASVDSHQIKMDLATNGEVLSANQNLCTLLGATESSLIGKLHSDIIAYDPRKAAENGILWDRVLKGESVYGRFKMPTSSGDYGIVEGGFSPVMDRDGKPSRVLLIGNDITTSQKELEEAEATRATMAASQQKVVDALSVGLSALSEGDLDVQITDSFPEEYEKLRSDFNLAVGKLMTAMSDVLHNAQSISGEATDISNAADDLSRRTERQAATLEETAAALDELTSSVKSAADGAEHANKVVNDARENAEAGGEVVKEAVEAMSEIDDSSEQISKIIGVIDDIAFQTNLLALNAGVEAARAGEAGRGFAVVASEVRALAQRSSEAAKEINELISKSGDHVKRGVSLVDRTGEALKHIVTSVSDIAGHVSEIAVSSQEQSTGLAEINTAVNQLDQVTQQNAAMFEETTAASHALTREAQNLTETMSRFKIAEAASGATPVAFQRSAAAATARPAVPTAPTPSVVGNTAVVSAPQEDDWEDF
jgi:methyl-accepting chemotaxis protein